jgi:hypothetical protein
MEFDDPINLIQESKPSYEAQSIRTNNEICYYFNVIMKHISGIKYENYIFQLIDKELSIIVSVGNPFRYMLNSQANEEKKYCKKYSIVWNNSVLAEIKMNVYRFNSSVTLKINEDSINRMKIIRHLKDWKSCNISCKNKYSYLHNINGDLFDYMLRFI